MVRKTKIDGNAENAKVNNYIDAHPLGAKLAYKTKKYVA